MKTDKKAKILLEKNSFIAYIQQVLKENEILDFMIEEFYFEEISKRLENTEDWKVETNWSDEAHEFIADGYTRDDIEYMDYEELEEDLRNDIIIDISQHYLEKYFEDDNDLLDDMQKYVELCLQ